MSSQDNTGVANPFALTELVAGRTIDWNEIDRPELILEEVLETPYQELFDPKYDSPLYPGLRLDRDDQLQPVDLPEVTVRSFRDSLDREEIREIDSVDTLVSFLERHREEGVRLRDLNRPTPRGISVDIDLGDAVQRQFSNLEWPEHIAHLVVHKKVDEEGKKKEWEPENVIWEDPGQFFNKVADFFDPVQGAVANCYYIAALSSVAWARPYRIAHKTRSIGSPQEEFVCMIRFEQVGNVDSKNNQSADIEVTEQLSMNANTNGFVYCRSSEPGEIWPGVYEKAFAKWITGNPTDKPDITATAWGNPVRAVRQLTGENNVTERLTVNNSDEQLWQFVRGQSLSRKTVHPVIASTYSSANAAPDDIEYADANLAASHAYSVLGWFYQNGRRYIVLRNPWGIAWETDYTLTGNWLANHVDWWKPITLGTRGVFAIEASTFKKYFRRIAVVKP